MIKRNGFLILISFFLLISFMANVYSFKNKDTVNEKYIQIIESLKDDIKEKENEIDKYKKGKSNKEDKNNIGDETEKKEENEDDHSVRNPINNNVKKFIEYAFSNNHEDYATRKKLAKNYMTDELYETIFSADGLNEEQLQIKIQVEEVEVFLSYDDDEKLIVRYVINESKANEEYNEMIVKYAEVTIEEEDNVYKVSEIKALTLDDWGI